ncbi:MAG: PASTA domain-containing protein [Oscillospiraceae bacterium]|nr:PASTA domain-containing protein [Oscillospiraceae bacterium]
MENYCLGCMERIEEGTEICPHCGYDQNLPAREAYHLSPGTILRARYLIGRVIGYGGFGVTYLGYDLMLGYKVAIKEYLPSEFATRVPEQQTLSIYTGEAEKQFEAGLRSFGDEAKRLAQFSNIPGVVKIYDVFHENRTAYIIMEFLDGESVADKLKREEKLPPKEAIEIMGSILMTLNEIHATGMIHRDVSPGNIFVTKDGQIKLLDFGAARFASAYHTKSLSIILKPGYAPEEQYRSRGNQGPWTDVYAAGATLYKMLTGTTPQESVERMVKDEIKEPSKLGIKINKNEETALMNALNVEISERTQSAGDFFNELCGGIEVERKKEAKRKRDEGRLPPWLIAFICCIPLVFAGVIFMFMDHGTMAASDDYTTVPNLINKNETDGKTILEEANLYMVVAGTVDVDFGESGLIQKFEPTSGSYIRKYETVEVYLSINETVFMPEVLYWNSEKAFERMEAAGLNTKIEYVDTADYAENIVIEQEFPEGEPLAKNSLITLKVAKGAAMGSEKVEVPSIAGMNIENAIKLLREKGLYICVVDESYGTDEKGIILEQYSEESLTKGSAVNVKISLGKEYVRMPDLFLKTKEDALKILKELGLVVKTEYQETNEYVEDLVVGQKETAGTKLYKGDTVTVILSKYKTGKVPDVVGLSEKEAKKLIEDAGFQMVVSSEKVPSADIKEGLIAKQSVTGEYQLGKAITVYISEGEKEVSVPNVTGMSASKAENELKSAGFEFASETQYDDSVPEGNVISYSPTGKQPVGTTIVCYISLGPERVDPPNVVGKDVSAAQQELSDAGFTSTVSYVHSEDTAHSIVMSQSNSEDSVALTVSKGTAGKYVSESELGNYPTSQYSVTEKTQYSYRHTGKETTQSGYSSLSGWNLDHREVVASYTETYSSEPSTGTSVQGDREVTREITGGEGEYITYYWVDVDGGVHAAGSGYSSLDNCADIIIDTYGDQVEDVYQDSMTKSFSNGSVPSSINENGTDWRLVSATYEVTVTEAVYHYWRWHDGWSEWSEWSDIDDAPVSDDLNVEKRTQTIYYVVGK